MENEYVLEYPYKVKDMILGKADMSLIDLVNQRQIRRYELKKKMYILLWQGKGEASHKFKGS